MVLTDSLHQGFIDAAKRYPDGIAVVEPGASVITFAELDRLSDRVRDRLRHLGVGPGDRVGMYVQKCIDGVAYLIGALKAGAAYVPVDPSAPPARNAYILGDCAVKLVLTQSSFEAPLREELSRLDIYPKILVLSSNGGGTGITDCLDALDADQPAPASVTAVPAPSDLAYILYTSGSTGKPKGVCLSHENAATFVNWCTQAFQPTFRDRFSSHAPFHFDLSILDLHVALRHGAAVVLVGEDVGKDPVRLARLISDEAITIWYSAPSILSLLAQFGNLPAHDHSSLRLVLFAGEVFPVKHLRNLIRLWPGPRYFNLYGPTETNVCTFYEVTLPIDDDRAEPFPIGRVCPPLAARVVNEQGQLVDPGSPGELCISGSGVMQGYWNLPEQTARSFLVEDGAKWYRTGDLVVEAPIGEYTYRGRKDRMVKRRGYRVELGEIEAGLYRHDDVKEAAAVALPQDESGLVIVAYLSCKSVKPPSLIEMKRFCSQNLPLYMIPDRFVWLEALPKTSTDKIDYQRLKGLS